MGQLNSDNFITYAMGSGINITAADASCLANDMAAFIWKLYCYWPDTCSSLKSLQ